MYKRQLQKIAHDRRLPTARILRSTSGRCDRRQWWRGGRLRQGLPRAPQTRGTAAVNGPRLCAARRADDAVPTGVGTSALPPPVADNGPLGVRVIFSPMTSPRAPHDSPAESPGTGSGSVIHGGNREHTPHVPSGPEHGSYLKPRHLVMMALGSAIGTGPVSYTHLTLPTM